MEWKGRARGSRAVREYLEALDGESDQALARNISSSGSLDSGAWPVVDDYRLTELTR
jgi:hypothetical protein